MNIQDDAKPLTRPLLSTDLDGLLRLYEDMGILKPTDSREGIERTWARILESELLHYVGVFVEGSLASTCHAVIVPNLSRGVRPYAIIENVGTLSTHRRRGLGKLALEAAIAGCWQAGCYKIMLASSVQNARAHAFYRALGFDANAKQSFVLTRPVVGAMPGEAGSDRAARVQA
jgi:GNAT superfamily N-acetyltransferase